MTEPQDDELSARLRAADPASDLPPTTPAEVSRLVEETMSHDPETEQSRAPRRRGPLTWLVAAAAATVILGVAVYAVLRGSDAVQDPPAAQEPIGGAQTVTELTAASAAAGRCQRPHANLLATKPVAVDATVQSITDGTVTLVPVRWYAGEETDLVAVDAPPDRLDLLLTSVDFEEGERYLVAADDDGSVMLCGFSAAWSPGLESLYAEAFPD